MKTRTKAVLLASGAVLLVAGSVLGTLAYLTDSETAVNTFTVGNVSIDLEETDVDGDGDPLKNEYRLVPGEEYVKDPTVTVNAGSETSYVRMVMTVYNWSVAEDALVFTTPPSETLLGGYDSAVWVPNGVVLDEDEDTAAFEFRYYTTADGSAGDNELPALFETLIVPGTVTGEELEALYGGGFKMVVEGHAIQAAGFQSADDAWAAFDAQNNS